jgi:5-oxoprolinase (ATP-hydrolysing)
LDDGAAIRVRIEIGAEGRAVIDFAGSAGVHPGNLNATGAIVRSAVLYVLRLLVEEDLPLNEGLLEGIELRVPEGMLAPVFDEDPRKCPPVAAGNVETSQRIVDTLLKAFRVAACSQGTMNNVVFGNAKFGYYETVCGGAGAGPGFAGADAVHTHMTNTRITDAEILEHRYPVRLVLFGVRRGSGGGGAWRGGNGVVREIEFLEPCSLSVIGEHRAAGPYGAADGGSGAVGTQRVERADGRVEELAGHDRAEMGAGDRLVLETPGGGGWGVAAAEGR